MSRHLAKNIIKNIRHILAIKYRSNKVLWAIIPSYFLLGNAFLSVFLKYMYLRVGKIFILQSLKLCSENHDDAKPSLMNEMK